MRRPLQRIWRHGYSLTGRTRTERGNQQLGRLLAFVAGAINAGGFLALGQYTSHMTGIVSSVADNLILGQWPLAAIGAAGLATFLLGAICTALLVNFAQRRRWVSCYAVPLAIEAILLLIFGILASSQPGWLLPWGILLLCGLMGLQNALITKISGADIRTTHVTGMVTDIGIELGRALYLNRGNALIPVRADRAKLKLLLQMVVMFFGGGLLGAWGFQQFGHLATLPLAVLLLLLALAPLSLDSNRWLRRL